MEVNRLGDPSSCCSEREPQFEQSVTERLRVRHPGSEAVGGEALDHHDRPVPFLGGEGVDPFFDLVVEFDLEHRPIIADMRSSHKWHVQQISLVDDGSARPQTCERTRDLSGTGGRSVVPLWHQASVHLETMA